MKKIKKTKIFSETIYEETYIKHFCDDCFSLFIIEIDSSFNEMRRDLYFENKYTQQNKLIEYYTNEKNNLKQKNGTLRNMLSYNKIFLYEILEEQNCCNFIKIPKQFKIKIINARFIVHDGNEILLLALGVDDKYYLFSYSGS